MLDFGTYIWTRERRRLPWSGGSHLAPQIENLRYVRDRKEADQLLPGTKRSAKPSALAVNREPDGTIPFPELAILKDRPSPANAGFLIPSLALVTKYSMLSCGP